MSTPRRLGRQQELEVAVKAAADPRTVRKVVAGEPVRGGVRDRIVRVLRDLNLASASEHEGRP
jgi:hypothetical protein